MLAFSDHVIADVIVFCYDKTQGFQLAIPQNTQTVRIIRNQRPSFLSPLSLTWTNTPSGEK
jgi:hypothetical protein